MTRTNADLALISGVSFPVSMILTDVDAARDPFPASEPAMSFCRIAVARGKGCRSIRKIPLARIFGPIYRRQWDTPPQRGAI